MLFDIFSKVAVLALARVATATPVSLEAREHDDFKQQTLAAHNWYRSQHGAAPLEWDDDLENNARNWAQQCVQNHQHDDPYGENIAWGSGWSSSYGWTNLFGHERVKFDFDNPRFTWETGHFSQLVWKSTTKLGCAWAHCSFGDYVACEYDPAGNVDGDDNRYYRENIGRQIWGNLNDEYNG